MAVLSCHSALHRTVKRWCANRRRRVSSKFLSQTSCLPSNDDHKCNRLLGSFIRVDSAVSDNYNSRMISTGTEGSAPTVTDSGATSTSMPVVVAVGTRNPAKLRAVEQACTTLFGACVVRSADVPSGVASQPMTDEETITGTHARASDAAIGASVWALTEGTRRSLDAMG